MRDKSNRSVIAGLRFAWMLARRDLKNRYAHSYAGGAWNIGVPLLYSLINVVVFSVLMSGRMGSRYGDIPFALFYFVPFSLWTVFSEVMARSTGILREYSYLINKIAFPAWVLPLVSLGSALLSQMIIFVFIAVLMITKGIVPANTAWVFFVIWALSLLITVGAAYAVAAISAFIPDMAQLVPVFVNVTFWLTPFLYPPAMIQSNAGAGIRDVIMTYNPFYYLIESSRLAVFGGPDFTWNYVGILCLVSALFLAIGILVFRKLQPGFADVV